MYRRLRMAGLAAAGVVAIGCGSHDASSSSAGAANASAGGNGGRIAIFSKTRNAFDACKDNVMEGVLKDAGFQVTTYYSDFKPALSSQNIQDALTKGVKGAIYGGQIPALDVQSLKALARANVPTVMNLGEKPAGSTAATVLPADSVNGGAQAVETLFKLRPDVKRIGLIPGTPSVTVDQTMKGIMGALGKHGVKPIATVNGDFTAQGGTKVAQDMLQAHPDIQAIITMGDDMALAAARVARTSGSKAEVIDVYGFSKDAVDAVANGRLLALMYAPVADWGRKIATAMVDVMREKPVPAETRLEMTPVDKSNAAQIQAGC